MVMGSVCPGGAVDPELGLQRGIDNQGGHGLTGISSGDMGLRVRFYPVSKSSFSILQMEVPTLLLEINGCLGRSTSESNSGSDLEDELMVGFENGATLSE